MTYCTPEEVITLTGLKPQHLRIPITENDDSEGMNSLKTLLETWISQCQNMIDSYCHTTFPKESVPGTVQNVCLRMTANMVAFSQTRRDTPLVKVNDWKVQITSSTIFTDDLKKDLEPFKVDKSNKSDTIDIFTITGD